MTRGVVPPLAPELLDLRLYLLNRDLGAPSVLPSPGGRVTTILASVAGYDFELDRIEWAYEQPNATTGRLADGFIIFAEQGDASVTTPVENAYKVSAAARVFTAWWPSGTTRSYAMMAYRQTWQGEQRTQRVTDPSWLNVVGAGGGGGGPGGDHSLLSNLSYATAGHTGFEPTVTKGDLSAGSSKIIIGGTGTGALIGAGASVDVAEGNLDHGSIGGLTDNDHTQYVNAVADTPSLDLTLAAQSISGVVLAAGVDHGGLGGLADDDHTQYPLLAGRAGGQTLIGGTASGDGLTLESTSHATKGTITVGDTTGVFAIIAPSTLTGGVQPASQAGDGTVGPTALALTGADGGNTTGTTGQTAGLGGSTTITAGDGGTAPVGSTNGQGGDIILQPGTSGQGLGTKAADPANPLQQFSGGLVRIVPNGTGRVLIGHNPDADAFFQVVGPHAGGPSLLTTPGNGKSAIQMFSLTGGVGQTTTGTTGQVGGGGGSIIYAGGAGGAAPVGSTNGDGGAVVINGGPPGAGAGTAGSYGILYLQAFGGATQIGYGLTVGGAVTLNNKITTYNSIATVDNGVPSELATVDLTTQSAAIGVTALYAVPASGAGLYRVSWVASVTRAASTSSVLGGTNGFRLWYTDADDSVIKITTAPVITNGTNTVNVQISGVVLAWVKASTTLFYLFDYTSVGATSMQYNLHIKCEKL